MSRLLDLINDAISSGYWGEGLDRLGEHIERYINEKYVVKLEEFTHGHPWRFNCTYPHCAIDGHKTPSKVTGPGARCPANQGPTILCSRDAGHFGDHGARSANSYRGTIGWLNTTPGVAHFANGNEGYCTCGEFHCLTLTFQSVTLAETT